MYLPGPVVMRVSSVIWQSSVRARVQFLEAGDCPDGVAAVDFIAAIYSSTFLEKK